MICGKMALLENFHDDMFSCIHIASYMTVKRSVTFNKNQTMSNIEIESAFNIFDKNMKVYNNLKNKYQRWCMSCRKLLSFFNLIIF